LNVCHHLAELGQERSGTFMTELKWPVVWLFALPYIYIR